MKDVLGKLSLRRLTAADEAAFMEGMTHWSVDDREWYTFRWSPSEGYQAMLQQLSDDEKGVGLPAEYVPATMFYGFVNGRIVGRLHLRHRLNDALAVRGGHIGYAVAPPYRGRGYACEILKLGIQEAKSAGVGEPGLGVKTRLLLTCADLNVGSWKVIERCRGNLESVFDDEKTGERVRRYWIEHP